MFRYGLARPTAKDGAPSHRDGQAVPQFGATGEQATDVHRGVADHPVLDVAVFPTRVAVHVKHIDGRIHHFDGGGKDVVGVIEFAGLLVGDDHR